MLKRTHTVEPRGGLTSSHTRVETDERSATDPTKEYRIQRLDARRVQHPSEGDQAQLEITLIRREFFGKREMRSHSSMILSPAQARALALAICPELSPANLPVNT